MTTESIKRTVSGRVVSDKMDKTIVVEILRRFKHELYGKYITRTSKIHVHDESNQAKIGDLVAVHECRPISKSKTWQLDSILERAES
jgi:small subunit ribosomal protein S17